MALERGLLHRVGALDVCLEEIVGGLRTSAPIALNFAKEAAHQSTELPLPAGLRLEADLNALLMTTTDRAEGIEAFLKRRTARFEAQ
jgi:enoyl-CoA hydratase/carnithine racemase